MKMSVIFLLLVGLVVAWAGVPQRGVIHEIKGGVAGPNPYIFITVPRGRSQSVVQGFEVIEDDGDEDDAAEPLQLRHNNSLSSKPNDSDEEDEGALDDDDDGVDNEQYANDDEVEEAEKETEDQQNNSDGRIQINALMQNGQLSQMMVSREHAGAIMVPDEIIEIEGHSVIDEKTGKAALLLPRSVLDSIPDGSVVALLEQPLEGRSEERANRVIVRRRRKGSRRNVKRRRVNGNNQRRRRRGGNRRRRVNNNRVRVVRVNGNGNRRRNVRRGGNRQRVVYQG